MTRPTRLEAAAYLADRSSFTPEQILHSLDVTEAAYVEAIARTHPAHAYCEHCRRLTAARDVLVGAPIHVEGQLTL